jgi:putative oxidoreductase
MSAIMQHLNLETTNLERVTRIGGRALIAALFIFAGIAKIVTPQPFLAHMDEFGVPEIFLPGVIGLEIIAGFALLIGWKLREAAGALAVFCVITAVIFHHELGIKAERTLFFKDLAIAGGLFMLAAADSATRRARRAALTAAVRSAAG